MIHQYLTGATGCITEDSVLINVTLVFSAKEKADIDFVTIDSTGTVQIKWAGYPGAIKYSLYRYADNDSSAPLLLTQILDTTYADTSAKDYDRHIYTYYIKAEDGCGHFTGNGLMGHTLKLSGLEDQNLSPNLAWNPYLEWEKGVKQYLVYRQAPGSAFKLLGGTNHTFYTDTSYTAHNTFGECYKVMAISNLSPQTGNSPFVSTSNIYCFSSSPQIYIPNIFTPNGDTLNDVFGPVCMGIKEYTMTIINRWGEKIFETTSGSGSIPGIRGKGQPGWDGTFKGIGCPNGVYVYFIKAEDYNGHTLTRKGMIMLEQ